MSELFDYGIQNEESNLRAHVCVNAGKVYVFQTRHAKMLLSNKGEIYRQAFAYQPNVKEATAIGYLVPPFDIPGCIPLAAQSVIDEQSFSENDTTGTKGQKAVNVVMKLLRLGWFSLPVIAKEINNFVLQREGLDIYVRGQWRIQVKCDYRGGEPIQMPDTTGNLYLQIAEWNPYKIY